MKHFFILNPAAGKGKKIQKLIEEIHTVCKARGVDYVVHFTERVGEATEFVRSCCKNTAEQLRFYACGGDGTVNETASGLVGCENAELGIIPMGTGNDFVRNFENKEYFFDVNAQLDGEAEKIDVLKYNDKYSVNMINVGFDCEVVKQVSKNRRNVFVPSKIAFMVGVVQKFFSMPDVKAKLLIDGVEQERSNFQLCAIANGSYCGGGFYAAPISDLRDGTVDVCMISPVSRMKLLQLVGYYKAGTYLEKVKDKNVINYVKCSSVEMKFETPTDICADGEIEKVSELKISTVKDAVNFCVPKGCKMFHPEIPRERMPSRV